MMIMNNFIILFFLMNIVCGVIAYLVARISTVYYQREFYKDFDYQMTRYFSKKRFSIFEDE